MYIMNKQIVYRIAYFCVFEMWRYIEKSSAKVWLRWKTDGAKAAWKGLFSTKAFPQGLSLSDGIVGGALQDGGRWGSLCVLIADFPIWSAPKRFCRYGEDLLLQLSSHDPPEWIPFSQSVSVGDVSDSISATYTHPSRLENLPSHSILSSICHPQQFHHSAGDVVLLLPWLNIQFTRTLHLILLTDGRPRHFIYFLPYCQLWQKWPSSSQTCHPPHGRSALSATWSAFIENHENCPLRHIRINYTHKTRSVFTSHPSPLISPHTYIPYTRYSGHPSPFTHIQNNGIWGMGGPQRLY